MKTRSYALKDAERIVPLLRSIGKELKARMRAASSIQKRLELLRAGSSAKPDEKRETRVLETDTLEAELATHLREARSAEKELERLGCRLDEQHPLRILIPSPNGDWAFDGHLDETQFYPSSREKPPERRSTSS